MANYDTTTKVIIGPVSADADTVAGSFAKQWNDAIEAVDATKTIRTATITNAGHKIIGVLTYDN